MFFPELMLHIRLPMTTSRSHASCSFIYRRVCVWDT